MTFIFWNIGRSASPLPLLGRLAMIHAADVVAVAECESPGTVLAALNSPVTACFPAPCRSRVSVFTRFDATFAPVVDEHRLYSIRSIRLPGRPDLILALAHLPSGRETPLDGRNEHCREFARRVTAAEQSAGHASTVVMGDFNLNPFDAGIAFAGGFHAVSDRRIAAKGSRVIQAVEHPFFYNPMWRFFGDAAEPSGSYYYWKADHLQYFWHLYDQVLLRPQLLARFRDDGLLIPTRVDGVKLLTAEGRPDKKVASDHLPLVLRLEV